MENWKTAHQEIARRIDDGRRNLTRELLGAGLLRAGAVALAGLAVGTALHLVTRMGSPVAWGVSLLVLSALGAALWRWLVRPMAARPDRERFVEWLDSRHDRQKNLIVSAWQLGRDESAHERYAPDIVAAIVQRGAAAAAGVDTTRWRPTETDRAWKTTLLVGAGVTALLVLLAGPDRFGGAARRLFDPRLAALAPVTVTLEPGNRTVEKGTDVDLSIVITGTDDPPILRVREAGGIWMSRRLTEPAAVPATLGGPIRYAAALKRVERDQEYQVLVQKVETPVWRISVNEAPRVAGFEITYYYPEYTGREPETVTSGSGDLAALAGTKVLLKVLANRAMSAARMNVGPAGAPDLSEPLDLAAAAGESNWETRLTLAGEPREYTVTLRGPDGAERFTSPRFRMEAAPDRTPIIRLVSPDADMPIPESMEVPLVVEAVDDYGLTHLDLVYSIKEMGEGRVRLKEFAPRTAELHGDFTWDLVPLNLFPGNEVTYYLEIFDNDRITGPKSARSEVRRLRFPTMEEMYAEVQEDHEKQIDDLSSTMQESQEIQEQLEKLARESKRGDEMSWEKKKELENLLQRHADLEQRMSDAARQLEETLRKAQEETLMDPELLQKMQELSELMKSIQNEKLKESFQKLSEALQNMDPEAVDRALEDFKLDQEEMVKSLDKTIEMLKEIRKEEMLADAVRKAEEMAREQQDLARDIDKETRDPEAGDKKDGEKSDADKKDAGKKDGEKPGEKSDPARDQAGKDGEQKPGDEKAGDKKEGNASEKEKELADRQAELQKKADDLAKQLEELSKLAENEPELKEELDQAQQDGSQKEMKENMEQSEESLRQGEKEKSLDFAFKASEDAQQMAQKMRQAQQNSNAAKKREMQEKLMAIIQDLVDVSSAQEEMLAQAPRTTEGEMAGRQRVLMDGVLKSALELEALGKRTLFVNQEQQSKIGSALNRMKSATQAYSSGNLGSGLREGRESAGDLNEAIVELMQSHSSMCNSGNPSGFMEQMQKMAGLSQEQQQLNDQAQGMANGQGSKPRLGKEGSAAQQLEEMAARQEMIKRGLDEIAGSLGDRRDVLGRMDQLGKEMEDVAEALRKNGLDPKVLERQEKILNRLLDAQKSIRKKDDREERESKTAEQLNRPSPGPLSREQLMGSERLRSDILRGQSDQYPTQFRSLVEKYFRALSEKKGTAPATPAPSGPAPDADGGSR